MADDRTVKCEHTNCELWLYIVADLLVRCELELNIYTIVQCMPSFSETSIFDLKKITLLACSMQLVKQNTHGRILQLFSLLFIVPMFSLSINHLVCKIQTIIANYFHKLLV